MSLVVMKSYQSGISLHMDEEAPFGDLLLEIAKKFSDARGFFKDSKVALSLEGRSLSLEDEKLIIKTITENSDVQIICLIDRNEETNKGIIRALKRVETEKEEYNGRFHKGTLREGQSLETEGSIVIIGNVMKGARVVASKDIIIIGSLFGEAYAGAGGDDNRFVVALKFDPQRLKIADLVYRNREKSIFSNKNKLIPQIARIQDGEIQLENITKELLEMSSM